MHNKISLDLLMLFRGAAQHLSGFEITMRINMKFRTDTWWYTWKILKRDHTLLYQFKGKVDV